ncbi:MAG: DUF2071 domain-containing protein [Akkermansiaceae bacterium]
MMISAPTPAQRLAVCARPEGSPVMRQRWSGLLFLHWPVDPEIIQERLPNGLFVDTYDGDAWLGVVPFFMERVRPVLLPPVPGLSWFLELNVRTYVHDAEGRPGVWFFSLDCNQPLAVEVARRFFHLPYEHAAMQAEFPGNDIDYHSRRKCAGAADAQFHYGRPSAGRPAVEGSLEWFLVERYLLFSARNDGGLYCGQVHHTPYQISPARCDAWSTEPLRLNGFKEPECPPPSMLVARPVDVRIFPLRKIRSGR